MELRKFEISDSKLEHNGWRFPSTIKIKPLRDLEDEDFLVNHRIDRSYDDSTVRFKLVCGNAVSANLSDTAKLPIEPEVLKTIKKQGWLSDEYEHLWRLDGGGSAFLSSHNILTFLLQTPRDGRAFCSLTLVNRERSHCGGFYLSDERFALETLLADQPYHNRHPKVPRDFAILPFQILVHHIEDTLNHVQKLSRELASTEKRIAQGEIRLEDNGDYKLLNRLNLEHLRVQRRSNFELELGENLLSYIDEYDRMWRQLMEGGTAYVDDMREKINQQLRYARQVKVDLDILPRRIKNQSKAIFNFIVQRDNKLNIQLAESSRRIAEESRRDNLLNLQMAAVTQQVAEDTRQDSAAMKTIAILTLTFLPGTAVASFFSMNNMFVWPNPPAGQIASPLIWVFFAVTIPLTLFVYAAWVYWFKVSQKKYARHHEEAVANFENELKSRVRTATGTW